MIVACIPCYNEEQNIAKVIIETKKFVDQVIVCDDGSNDFTSVIAENLDVIVIKHKKNLGKGIALKSLFNKSKSLKANIIITLDGDGQHNPNQIPQLIDPILKNEFDVVIGSRFIGQKSDIPRYRKVGLKILDTITNHASKQVFSDTQSGFRAYSKKAISKINIKENGIGVDSEILIQISNHKFKITDVPVTVSYDQNSHTYNPINHGSKVMVTIIKTLLERSPLRYFGLTGLSFIIIGTVFFIRLIQLYNTSGGTYFSLPWAFLAVSTGFIGLIFVVTALLLYSFNRLKENLET